MEEEYKKEKQITNQTQIEKEKELIENIIKTREDLKSNSNNFEFAEIGLVDYYIYEIKANQAKLDYLLNLAKKAGITLETINKLQMKNYKTDLIKVKEG